MSGLKKITILFNIISILLFANCILSEDVKNDEKDDQSIVENYLPSSLDGSVYKFHAEKYNYLTSISDTLTYTESISGPVNMDGHEYYTIVKSNNSETMRFCVETNNIYFLVEENMFPIVGSNPDTPIGYNSKFFDFSASQGNKYDILDWGTLNDEFFIHYNFKGEFLGYETVETKLADFQDCSKFQIQYNTKFTPFAGGEDVNYSRIETHWFAPNTGTVKRVIENFNNGNSIDTTNEELIELYIKSDKI